MERTNDIAAEEACLSIRNDTIEEAVYIHGMSLRNDMLITGNNT